MAQLDQLVVGRSGGVSRGLSMAILTKSKVRSGHWYRPHGTPAHKMRTADGRGERATTIGNARRLGLYEYHRLQPAE